MATLAIAGVAPLSVSGQAARPIPAAHRHQLYGASRLAQPATGSGQRALSAAPPVGATWTPRGPQPIRGLGAFGPSAGRVTALATNVGGAVVYAGAADGGVWKSIDSGQNWTTTTDSQPTLGIGALAVDWTTTPETVYAGTGEDNHCQDCQASQGVLKSVDGGQSWVLVGQPTFTAASFHFGGLAVDAGSANVLAATDRGLYRSIDGGTSWTLVLTGGTNEVVHDPSSPAKFWAVQADWCRNEQGAIWTSVDAGATWQQTGFIAPAPLARIALGIGKNGVAYAALAGCPPAGQSDPIGQLVGIRKTTNGGTSWQATVDPPADYFQEPGSTSYQGWYDTAVGVDPNDSTGNTAVFGGVTMLVTADGGGTYKDVAKPYAGGPLHPDFHAIAFFGRNSFYTGNDGGVYSTTDLGGTASSGDWTNRSATLSISQFYGGSAIDLNNLAGGTQDNGTAGIVPGGPAQPAWASLLEGDGTYTAMIAGSSTMFASQTSLDLYQVNMANPANPGSTEVAPCPSTTFTDASCSDPTGFVAPFVMDPTSSSPSSARLYAGTNRVYRTTSGGLPAGGTGNGGAWSGISPDLTTQAQIDPGGDWINAMAIGAGNTVGTVITGSWYGKVFLSNSASTASPAWIDITGNLPPWNPNNHTVNAWITGVAVNPLNRAEAWVTIGTLSGQRVWHTIDAGATPTSWSDLSTTLPPNLVAASISIDPVKPQNVYLGTDAGAMICTSCGGSPAIASWAPLGTGLPNARVDALTLTRDHTQLVAWTHGRGAWSMPRPIPTPAATLVPTSLDFGGQVVSTTSAPRTFTLNSTGSGPLTVSSITASGDFSLTSAGATPCPPVYPFVLAAGSSCTIGVTVTPNANGPRQGTLTVNDDSSASPQTASLAANGTFASWESLQGSLGSGPDVSSWASGRLDVFARAPDGSLIHKWFSAGAWSPWESLGGQIASDPTAISWGPSRLDIFARSASNTLVHTWYDGAIWHPWESLGGQLTSGPDASSWAARRLDIFARGTDSGLIHKWYDGTAWHDWESLGGMLTADPSAVSWSSRRLDIFGRGSGYELIHKWYDGTAWHDWETLGGSWTSSPDVASWGPGRLDAFIRGTDGAMWHKWYDGAGWHPAVSLGGQFTSDPGAVAWGTGRLDIFARGQDGSLRHTTLSG